MSDRQAVRAELERKRIQLAQMRQERERRSRMLQESENSSQNKENRDKLDDADAVLQALGISAALSRASTAPSNVSAMDQSRISAASPDSGQLGQLQTQLQQQLQQQQLNPSLSDPFSGPINSTPKPLVPLELVHVNQINIAPKERVYYTKSTQTPAPIVVPPQGDQAVPQSDAPQQKSYYGKQTNTTTNVNPPTQSQSMRSTSTNGSDSQAQSINSLSTPPVAGVTIQQLALEWDDEFPGMFRSGLDIETNAPHRCRSAPSQNRNPTSPITFHPSFNLSQLSHLVSFHHQHIKPLS